MATEAIRRAAAKYDKANTKMVPIKLNKKVDADICGWLEKIGNKQGYIKKLIRKDMKEEELQNE